MKKSKRIAGRLVRKARKKKKRNYTKVKLTIKTNLHEALKMFSEATMATNDKIRAMATQLKIASDKIYEQRRAALMSIGRQLEATRMRVHHPSMYAMTTRGFCGSLSKDFLRAKVPPRLRIRNVRRTPKARS
jgi:hypothetical protein